MVGLASFWFLRVRALVDEGLGPSLNAEGVDYHAGTLIF